jgi:hypothetical protein
MGPIRQPKQKPTQDPGHSTGLDCGKAASVARPDEPEGIHGSLARAALEFKALNDWQAKVVEKTRRDDEFEAA